MLYVKIIYNRIREYVKFTKSLWETVGFFVTITNLFEYGFPL
jgi:hypothetical protein